MKRSTVIGGTAGAGFVITALLLAIVLSTAGHHARVLAADKNAKAQPTFAIDGAKRYTVFCDPYKGNEHVYPNAKILGFTPDDRDSESGSFVLGSISFYGKGNREAFAGWLALELQDGRRAFLPSGTVQYLEEAPAEQK